MAKILVADDAAFMRLRLRSIIEGAGHNVVEAANGQEAVDVHAEQRPEITFMDITMPQMDGIAALKAIRDASPSACVIMCSALGQQSMVIQAIQAGASDFIVKPFEPDRVLATVERMAAVNAG